jgi:uncharacterized protein YqeY
MKKYSNIEIDLSLEQYYILNEEAREKNILLDDYIANILKKYIKKHQESFKQLEFDYEKCS